MKRILAFSIIICSIFLLQSFTKQSKKARILVFSKTKGFRHNSIETGKLAIQQLGLKNNFEVDTTENADAFVEGNLKKYATVVFLSTTGDVLNDKQQTAFEKYIKAGGGYVGIHAATDTEYDWPWYGKLAGAYFVSHPEVQEARFVIKDKNHPSTKFFTDSVWMHKDELYNFKDINPDIKVLISIDETSYKGGKNGNFHPFSWYHNYDGGRAFYTSMGHTRECWTEDKFLNHLLGGIKYAMGKSKF
ncbi:ThuA domain-containing protein [Pedobacter aquatilis]|uniref:ThuA domain-containing protein n=1 Tax=Pedobacter aquatilis TaxID=351343 RepID=UPI00292CD1A0|nr:ThuA domain-containing protein [Pedobacter aquatilis]